MHWSTPQSQSVTDRERDISNYHVKLKSTYSLINIEEVKQIKLIHKRKTDNRTQIKLNLFCTDKELLVKFQNDHQKLIRCQISTQLSRFVLARVADAYIR